MNERNQRFLGRTAVAGVGFTEFSRNSGQSVLSLATQACRNAIDDAGIPVADVDGIVSFQFQEDSVPTQAVATALGLPQANYLLDTALGGQAPCYLVMQAAMAIDAGLADNVLVFRALNGRSGNRVGTAKSSGPATGFRYPIGLSAYLQVIALWARRFMIETGATPEDLASVPLAQRQYAAKNERAMINKPMTLDEYMAKDFVAEPFRAADCTIEVDGACAVLVTSPASVAVWIWATHSCGLIFQRTTQVCSEVTYGARPESAPKMLIWPSYTTVLVPACSSLWKVWA